MSQGEAMSENEATEGGVIFEELSTVRCYIVDGGSGSERACKAPSILLERGRAGHLGGGHTWYLQRWRVGGWVQRR